MPIAIDFELLGVQAERGCDPQQAFTRSVTWGISLTHHAIAIHEAEERLGKTSLLVVGTSSMATNLTAGTTNRPTDSRWSQHESPRLVQTSASPTWDEVGDEVHPLLVMVGSRWTLSADPATDSNVFAGG